MKPKLGTKGHEPKWNSTRHIIIITDGNKHLMNYFPKTQLLLRHGLLKV